MHQRIKETLVKRLLVWLAAACLLPLSAAAQNVTYIHTDALGSPVLETNAQAQVVRQVDYRAYGMEVMDAPRPGPGYTGHYRDVGTGLVYMQQRYYDPMLGLFLSTDPVTAYSNPIGQFHRYRYANNNPYKFTDPDGREIRPINSNQAAQIENDINAQASEEFRFDSNNRLQSVGPNPSGGGSQTYSNSLNDGISANTVISVGYQQTYTDASGATVNIDAQHGGGLTGQVGSGNLVVLVSGNPVQTTDAAGNPITDSSADVLRHEFVSHAVPQALARDATGSITNASGNGISNDNATRLELGKPLLAPDPSHTEYQP